MTDYVRTRKLAADHVPALRQMISDIATTWPIYKELANVPPDQTRNFRNDMYLVSEALRLMQKIGHARVRRRRRAPC